MPMGRLDLVRQKSEQWAREIIDFGPANTLLHYKDTRTQTIDLTNAEPDAMANLLAGRRTLLSTLVVDRDALGAALDRARTLRRRIVMVAEEQGLEIGRLARGLIRVEPPAGRRPRAMRPLRAPLLLHPVRIEARTATEADYVLEVDQEAEINPVLLVALRDHFGVDLQIDDVTAALTAALAQSTDGAGQVQAVHDALREQLGTGGGAVELESRIVIGGFAFDKLPMVEDLRSSVDLLAQHDVIAAAAGDQAAVASLSDISGAQAVHESDDVAPVDEFLVHPADSSQHRALQAILGGRHVVIQGPPGTGKSQTIANAIASAAAAGKSVLFVAEKRAAIEAVTERLADCGLTELVFDLHGDRTRREVASQVAASLVRAGTATRPDVDDLHRELTAARRALVQHEERMHEKRGPWGLCAYEVIVALHDLPEQAGTDLRLRRGDLERLDRSTVERLCRELSQFVNSGGFAVRRGESVWSGAEVRDRTEAEQMLARLDAVTGRAWCDSQRTLRQLVVGAGLRAPVDLAGWQRVIGLLTAVERTTGQYSADIYGDELGAWCAAACPKNRRADYPSTDGWWRRYQLRRMAMARRRDGRCTREVLFAELAAADTERATWRELADDPTAEPGFVGLDGAYEQFAELRDTIAAIAMTVRLDGPENLPVDELAARLEQLRADEDMLFKLPDLMRISTLLEQHGLGGLLDGLARRDAEPQVAQDALRYVWFRSLLDRFRLDTPELATFSARQHDAVVASFCDLDRAHLGLNAERIRRRVAEQLRDARDTHPDQNATVLGEANRKRGHMTVRKLVTAAPDVLLAARPCWAMSPIVVSRLLPARQLFDIVIFDEASQVEAVDAMTSIMRGRQLVVAGDHQQLPPSAYFRTLAGGGAIEARRPGGR